MLCEKNVRSHANKVCMVTYGPEKDAVKEQYRILLDKGLCDLYRSPSLRG